MSLNTPDIIRNSMEVPPDLADDAIQGFLDDANLFVSETLVNANFSTARFTAIEKYICCHLMLMLTERGGLTSSQTGEYSRDTYVAATFANEIGFAASRYGQQAIMLDSTGALKGLSSKKLPAQFGVKGGKWFCEPTGSYISYPGDSW